MLKSIFWFLYRHAFVFKRVIWDGDTLEHARYMYFLHGLDMATLRRYPNTPTYKLPSAATVPTMKGAIMTNHGQNPLYIIAPCEREPGHTRENGEPDDAVNDPPLDESAGPK